MVPLASLDTKDTLPCPLTIQPALPGKCHWITTSALEFIPDPHFAGSTHYIVSVKNPAKDGAGLPGLAYPLEEEKKVEIDTPLLALYTSEIFDPQAGMYLSFNFSVDKNQLNTLLNLSEN